MASANPVASLRGRDLGRTCSMSYTERDVCLYALGVGAGAVGVADACVFAGTAAALLFCACVLEAALGTALAAGAAAAAGAPA